MNKIRVRKRGSTYYFSFEAGRKPDGKRRTIERGGFSDEQSAYDAGVQAYTDWRHGEIGITTERISMAEYLDVYLNIRQSELRPASRASYRCAANQLKKHIGAVMLQDLRPRDVDAMYRKMVAEGKAKQTIGVARAVLQLALDYAVYPAELISSNPARAIKLPRNVKPSALKRVIIDAERLHELLYDVWPSGHFMHTFCLLAYHTGMRVSEVCGLTWNDIDLDKGVLHVERQLHHVDGLTQFGPPKTPTSEREMYLDTKIVNELRLWQREQKKQMLSAGLSYMLVFEGKDRRAEMESRNTRRKNPIPLVLTHTDGKFVISENISKHLVEQELNSHSFRHTHSTLLAEDSSITPKELAARLGHKNVNLTQNVYTHVTEKMKENAREVFQKIVDRNP